MGKGTPLIHAHAGRTREPEWPTTRFLKSTSVAATRLRPPFRWKRTSLKRSIAFGLLILLIGSIAVAVWLRANRYEILANSDLKNFADSDRTELYTFYPHLIDRIADSPGLAERVVVVHLSVSDFKSEEFYDRNFSSLARLPNLTTVECTYSHNVDKFVPTLNLIATLVELRLYYCDPIAQALKALDANSLQSINVHSYNTLVISDDVIDEFEQRMPDCMINFTTD